MMSYLDFFFYYFFSIGIPALAMDPPSSEGRSETRSFDKAPATVIDPTNDQGKAPSITEKKKKKKKKVRYTQEQILYCIGNPEELPERRDTPKLTEALGAELLAKLPPDLVAHLRAMDDAKEEGKARRKALIEELRHEREVIYNICDKPEDVLKQYYAKGYAEYEVIVDDDEHEDDGQGNRAAAPAQVAAPLTRRRFRNGVAYKKSQTGGGSIRKIN